MTATMMQKQNSQQAQQSLLPGGVQRPFTNMQGGQRPINQNGTPMMAGGTDLNIVAGAPVAGRPLVAEQNMAAMDNFEFRHYKGNPRFDNMVSKFQASNSAVPTPRTWGELKTFFRTHAQMPPQNRDQFMQFVSRS